MSQRPVLLLVHGAWFGAWSWDGVRSDLTANGWQVQTVELPSMAEGCSRRFGLYDDVEVVRARIKAIDGPVVVVAHSYGGAVVTQAADDLANVRHLVYISGFQLDVGEALKDIPVADVIWWEVHDDISIVPDPHTVFFNDLPREAADKAVARLRPITALTAVQPLTSAAWRTIPSTYVVTERDNSFAVKAQEALAARAGRVYRLPSGHVPLLSMPSVVAALIVEACSIHAV
jgi:pimeloyl-ACP methyl ester carboxylesterase